MSFKDQFKKAVHDAPVRQPFVNVNYGKARFAIKVLQWHGRGQAPTRVDYTENYNLKEGETLELEVGVGVKELNPALQFEEWTRRINIEASNKTAKDPSKWILTDWSETVEPSLVKVFGEDGWVDAALGKKIWYVAVEQADSLVPPKDGKRDYGVPRFIGKYKNLAECKAARDERFPPSANEVPEGNGAEIPESILTQARGLANSVGNNTAKLKAMLAGNPFGEEYTADDIIAALKL